MNKIDIKKTKNSTIRIGAVSINSQILNLAKNGQKITQSILACQKKGVELVLFPELALTGYGAEDVFLSIDWANEVNEALVSLVKTMPKGIIACVGMPLWYENQCFNVIAVIAKDRIYGFFAKQNLAKTGLHYEPRWFMPWPKDKNVSFDFMGYQTHLGQLVFHYRDNYFAFEICEDAWAASRVANQFHQSQPTLILNASASHFAINKFQKRQQLVESGSKIYQGSYVYCNLLGCEAGRSIYDGGNLFAHNGKIIHEGERFSFNSIHTDIIDCPYPSRSDLSIQQKGIIDVPCETDSQKTKISKQKKHKPLNEYEEVANAIMLGLWDWQRKTHTNGFTLSLSGGADSSLCAAMVYLMQQKALKSLSKDDDCQALAKDNKNQSLDELMKTKLTTVYQGTKYSSKETQQAASELAESINSNHFDWQIEKVIESYHQLIKSSLQIDDFHPKKHDIALQNIQARVRSPGIWMMANLKNQLLLATSNLSEACVGYCTMDGDTSGVLSPISGLSKSFVLKLNRYLFETGIRFSNEQDSQYKVLGLEKVIQLKPSAELRSSEQLDEEDLMPYEVLDAISHFYHVNHLSEKSIKIALKKQPFSKSYDEKTLNAYADKFFNLYRKNQWKRERLAPGFHLQEDSCCPKTYRRYPMLT